MSLGLLGMALGAQAQMSPDVLDPGIVVVGEVSRCGSKVVAQSLVKAVLSRFKNAERGKPLTLSEADRTAFSSAVQSAERSCKVVPQSQCNGGLMTLQQLGGVLVRLAPEKACH